MTTVAVVIRTHLYPDCANTAGAQGHVLVTDESTVSCAVCIESIELASTSPGPWTP